MFDVFFRKYKEVMFKDSIREVIKQTDSIILIALIIVLLGGVTMVISTLVGCKPIILISSFGMFMLGFIGALIRNKYLLSNAKYLNKIELRERDRFTRFVRFLNDSKVELDDTQIDTLIKIAQTKQDISDDSKSFLSSLSGVVKYIFIPIITLIIKDYLESDNVNIVIIRSFTIVVVALVLTITFSMVSVMIKNLFNGERERLRELIADLTEVKSFKNQAKEIFESKEKLKTLV